MKLIYASVCLSIATVYFCIILIGARDPRKPWWVSDTLVANIHSVGIISLGLAGILTFITALLSWAVDGTGWRHALIAVSIAAMTALGVKAMRVGEKLAGFARMEAESNIIKPCPAPGTENNDNPTDSPKLAA